MLKSCSDTSRATRLGGLALLLTAVGLVAGVQGLAQQGTQGTVRKVDYNFTRGVDMRLYVPVQGEAVCDMKRCERSAAAREETKRRAYEEAFIRVDQMGRTYRQARPSYFEGFKHLTEGGDRSILREDVRFLKAVEIYDYKHGEYKYTVRLGVRRLPRLDPQLDAGLREFLQRTRPRPDPQGRVVFDLTKILEDLEKDERFRKLLESLPKDGSATRYKDDDTQSFVKAAQGIEIQGYDKGQYSVNALIGSIIERSVVPAVQSSLRDYRSVTVVCEGGTDRLSIRSTFPYSGLGRTAAAGKELALDSQDGAPLANGIRDNLALSFARGYEGIRALQQILQPILRSGRIELRYTGAGEVADRHGSHPESRRIKFKVIPGLALR